MTAFLLIGIFCVLAVIGFFLTGKPFKFAIGGLIFLIALAFVSLVTIVVWSMTSPCTAPFHSSYSCEKQTTQTQTSTYTQNTVANSPSNDPFPFKDNECDSNGCPQYEWYDRHNVPMSDRCYPSMTNGCTDAEWIQAIGTTPN